MQACKTASSEIHNQRQKTLGYVREDLTHLNSYKVIETVHDCEERIRTTYQSVVGQKMQASATPIEEAVIVLDKDASLDQLIRFGNLCHDRLGITPIQYYVHMDEGHYDAKTREWKPNYHGHVIFDTTCREHVMVQRQVKRNGKVQKGPDGKPLMHEVDNYGKIIRLSPSDMSLMQDLAAEATGLKRGVASDAVHLDAQRYKAQALAEQSRRIEQDNEKLLCSNNDLTKENAVLRETNVDLTQTSSNLRQEVSRRRLELKTIKLAKSVGTSLKKGFDRLAVAVGISPELKRLQKTVADQAKTLDEKSAENGRLEAQLHEITQRRDELQRESNRNLYRANEAEKQRRENGYTLVKVAYRLAATGPALVSIFEKMGLPELLGEDLWKQARRETMDRGQDVSHSRGIRR